MNKIIIFFVFLLLIGLIAAIGYSSSEGGETSVFRINNKKYEMSKIYTPSKKTWLYIEKEDDEKTSTGNYVCDNFTLLPVSQDVFLLRKI